MAKADVNEPVTRGMLNDAVEAVLKGVDALMNGFRVEMNTRFDKLEAGQRNLQHQINDLKHDTPTQKEFDELKARVDKYSTPSLKTR